MTERLGIDELAELGGVSRRTVRYYIQAGLLPAPHGLGRGPHYGREHLDRLLRVKTMQEAGRTLDEIKGSLAGRAQPMPVPHVARTTWRRLSLAPGVELHVAADVQLPPPGTLQQMVEWCRAHLRRDGDDPKENDG